MKRYGLYTGNNSKNVKLNKLNVSGNICGEYIEYTIAQTYKNTYEEDVHCTYTFPIPPTATLTGLQLTLGGKNLEAAVESREEVLKIIENAKEENLNPISLESTDEDEFQITIGDVMPNETVVIKITYMDQLIYDDNLLKLIIPSLVDPTYVLSESDEEITEEGEFYLNLLVESYGDIEIKSDSHKIKVEKHDETLSKITIDKGQTLYKDLVIEIEEKQPRQADGIAYSYYDQEEETDKSILMMRLFPILPDKKSITAKNYSFVVDLNYTMDGNKLEEAKNALLIALRSLDEGDFFNIVSFSDEVYVFSPNGKVKYTKENLDAATEWIENMSVKSGADIFSALKEVLREAEEEEEPSYIFLFTDDAVENEEEVLDYVKTNIGDSRIFPFGMDTETNSYFVNKLAEVGYGIPEFVEEGQRIDDIILRQFNRIHNPQMDVVSIDWGNMDIEKVYPGTLSYLYDREPFTMFAKVRGTLEGKIHINGLVNDKEHVLIADFDKLEIEENQVLIEKVWARKIIEALEEKKRTQRGHEKENTRNRILEISKEYNMLSSETAFILLETIEDQVSGFGMNRIVPVDMSEDTMRSLSEAYFLDDTRYNDDTNIREKMAEGLSIDEAKKAITFERENLLRILARNQQADGSFANIGEEDSQIILETTLKGLLAFTSGNEPATIYLKNINKAFAYVINAIKDDRALLSERNLMLLSIAYEMAEAKRLMQEKTKASLDNIFDKVEDGKFSKNLREVETVVATANALQRKYIMAAILNISSAYVKDLEDIFVRDIKSNIDVIAESAIAKTL